MAKSKVKKEMSLEERLDAALVPEDEQPYEVPGNWCWVKLGTVIRTSKEKTENFDDLSTKYVGLEHLEKDRGIIGYGSVDGVKSLKSIFHKGQVLYGKLRPYLNKHDVADFDGVCSTDILVFDAWKAVSNIFLNYYFNQKDFLEYAISHSKGINLPRVSEDTILDAAFPLPPLAEQQRIVERIESLFSQLDEARDKVQEALDSFEKRKASLYKEAFSGKLTQNWRKHHCISDDSWENTTIGSISSLITKGASPRWQGVQYTDDESQTLFVTSENVREGYLDLSKKKYLDNKINDIQKRSILLYGDVLVNIVGASIGRSAIYNSDVLANTNQAVCIVRLNDMQLNTYVCFYLNSPTAQHYYMTNKVETARANISLADISNMPISLPDGDEIQEIIKLLTGMINEEDSVKDMVNAIIENIDMTKKSILAKAFRGELGTNDPEDDSALELLEQILKDS